MHGWKQQTGANTCSEQASSFTFISCNDADSTIAYLYSPTLVKLILTRLLVMGLPAVSRLHGITLGELYEHDTKAILIQTPTGSEG